MKQIIMMISLVLIILVAGCSSACNLVTPKSAPKNQPPRAFIDIISRENANSGVPIHFEGHGTDVDGTIAAYSWRSNIDGELSNSARFETSTLSPGEHIIYFKVKDNTGIWSEEVHRTVNIFHSSMPVAGAPPVINFFYAIPNTITKGQSTTLVWEVSDATSVLIQPKVGNVSPSGSYTVSPDSTMSYSIIASNANATVSTTITVTIAAVIPFTVTGVAVLDGPPSGNRPCPFTMVFSGAITTNGPCTVTYRWERSDGTKGPTQSLTFYEAGTQKVTYSWSVSASGTYSARIRTLTPKEMVSRDFSAVITCKPSYITDVRVVDSSASGKFTCPTTLRFTSSITVDGPCTVTYLWVRSDGVASTTQKITFNAAGTQTVTYLWKVSQAGTYWARLHTITPNAMKTLDYITLTIACE